MRYVIAGGSGQVGPALSRVLVADGHDVVVLTRDPDAHAAADAGRARAVGWDACTRGPWAAEIDGADVVVNLAGRSVWERTLDDAHKPHTRKVGMRSAMIMSPDRGGIFDTLRTLARRGLSGPAAGGRQYISWIHHLDFTRAVAWLTEQDEIEGAINLASPNPLPNAAFMRELRHACGARIALPATKLMLEAGAVLMRTESELVLKSRRVVPGRLLEHGFAFVHPDWPDAARELCSATRRAGRAW